jgi:formylmethanofuran dehydrogenase subunit B
MTGEAVTCPFCGLACDDLVASTGGVDTRGCARAAAGFARGDAPTRSHAVNGAPADFATATAAAAAILRASKAPLFHGLTGELHGVRAILALAERVGGTVDHAASAGMLANLGVARASGWVTATFAEVANRADFILLVGSDPERNFPRFHDRLLGNPTPLYRMAPPTVAYLGTEALAPPPALTPLRAIVSEPELLPAMAALSALIHARQPRLSALPGDQLAAIAAGLQNARYGVIAWEASRLDPGTAELVVEYLAGMLRHLNAATRCVGLPLGGSGNALGAAQAALWQTGWPLRVSFADGAPRHDPWQHDGRRILAAGEADALVWCSALTAEPPPATKVPVIALVADDVDLAAPAAVEIRLGIPAIHHGGEIVRADAVITLPLRATRPERRPGLAEAAQAILAGLEATP